jgi:hypothetical protein
MGNKAITGGGSVALGSRSTALEVSTFYSNGQKEFLTGKVAVITGGNSGIGLEMSKALSNAGCRVIMGSRSVEAGKEAIEKEVKKPGNGDYVVTNPKISVKQLNLGEGQS